MREEKQNKNKCNVESIISEREEEKREIEKNVEMFGNGLGGNKEGFKRKR